MCEKRCREKEECCEKEEEDEECESSENCHDEAMKADKEVKEENHLSKENCEMWEGVLAVLDDNLDWTVCFVFFVSKNMYYNWVCTTNNSETLFIFNLEF